MSSRSLNVSALAVTLLVLGGCSAGSVVDRAVGSAADAAAETAGERVGEAVGERLGQMLVASFPDSWTPRYTNAYTGYLFSVAFHSGSYVVTEDDAYEPGEWTEWRMVDGGERTPTVIERALLARTDEGEEWWRVSYENTDDGEEIVLEGLFSPDRSELLRLRGKFPGEEAKEMPVEEGTYGYAEPTRLTPESVEGATVGTESVTVPAGSFEARHVRYGQPGATLEWWLSEDVPGDMVRYLRSAGGQSQADVPQTWTAELTDYGADAESELGVMAGGGS